MYPVQREIYNHRSTMMNQFNQFTKPGQQPINIDPYPFTNANLTDLSSKLSLHPTTNGEKQRQYTDIGNNYLHQDLYEKEDSSINTLSTKKSLSKAERRAEHNAIERARRETLNFKFQSLAQALPNLINYRRPSKSQIIEKAVDWVKQSLSREERYRYQILQLQRENKRLLSQLMPQQQQENTPPNASTSTAPAAPSILRHSVSTPTLSTTTSNGQTTAVPPQMYASYSASTTSADYNNVWSTSNHHIAPPHVQYQMTSFSTSSSTEDLIMSTAPLNQLKQRFVSPKSDDEDNLSSSGNEDDLDYHNLGSLDDKMPQFDHRNQCILTANEMYSINGTFPVAAAEAQFNSASLSAHWNQQQQKYYPQQRLVNSNGNTIIDSSAIATSPLPVLS